MSSSEAQPPSGGTPIFLLKTRSTPTDAYEQLFSTPQDGLIFEPRFVPVLKHHFESEAIARVRSLLRDRKIGTGIGSSYGGLIFTSQRAVEAFAKLVEDGRGPPPLSGTAPQVNTQFANLPFEITRRSRLATPARCPGLQRRSRDLQSTRGHLSGPSAANLRWAHRNR